MKNRIETTIIERIAEFSRNNGFGTHRPDREHTVVFRPVPAKNGRRIAAHIFHQQSATTVEARAFFPDSKNADCATTNPLVASVPKATPGRYRQTFKVSTHDLTDEWINDRFEEISAWLLQHSD